MKSKSRLLDNISGYLFLLGFITYRLRTLPTGLVSAIFNAVSIIAYLLGYVVWYIAALFYPAYPRKHEHWYGFAEFKEQYQIAALLGTIATVMCIIAPPLIIPTAWLYSISNLIWSISEHHKSKNPPPEDDQYSSAKQSIYLKYSALVTASSILTAIVSTAIFLFPPLTSIALLTSTIVGLGLSTASLYYWIRSHFGTFPPDNVGHSYNKLSDQLSFPLEKEIKPGLDATSMQNQMHKFTAATNATIYEPFAENTEIPNFDAAIPQILCVR